LGVAGDCSLRRALDKAVSGVDNIVIPASVPTITLVAGNGPLPVTKNLTIAGQGPGTNTVTGGDAIGLFDITGQRNVTISGVTLTHGKAQFGAAIDSDGGHLTLNNVAVTNNASGGSGAVGFGAITMSGASPATLTITGSSIASNHVGGGAGGTGFGAVFVSPSGETANVTISDTDFTGNTSGGGGATGFGVLNATPSGAVPTVDLESVVFRGNSVGGGAIGFGTVDFGGTGDDQQLTVRGSTFDSNTVGGDGGSGDGGGIYTSPNGTATIKVEKSTFLNNHAGGAGGATNNSGSGFGGAIHGSFSSVATMTISDSAFTGNTAGGAGGAGTGSGEGFGGAIYSSLAGTDGKLSVTGSQFSHNTAGGAGGVGGNSGEGFGGALLSSDPSVATITIAGNSFSDSHAGGAGAGGANSGAAFGGAVHLGGGAATTAISLVNNTITGSSAGGTAGGGSTAGFGFGGGLYAGGGTIDMRNNTIDGNTIGATTFGGGVYAQNSGTTAVTLRNNVLAANVANGAPNNCVAALTSGGGNLEDTTPSQCGLTAPGDRVGINPLLRTLADNGGLTLTQRLLAGSPAINGGGGCPATDQRGVARPVGGACDIGAYELATPSATTGPASAVAETSATLGGTAANPDVRAGSAHFDFGTDTTYGSQTSAQALAAGASGGVSAALTGLKPGTLYHYRLVASNPDGATAGADQTFKTTLTPKLGKIGMKPTKFAASKGRGASISARRRGATVSYTDNTAATSTFTVQTPRRGYRSGKRCVARKPKGHKRARRCTFYKKVGSFTHKDAAGKNSFHFTGRVKRKPLRPGRYRFEVVARENGLKSKKLHKSFRVLKA
jgi:hypothetical protein